MGSSEDIECPACGKEGVITDYKHGDILCKKCGLVLDEKLLQTGPESWAYDEAQIQKRQRTGSPTRFSKLTMGLETQIDMYDRDIKGHPIPASRKAQMYRLRKLQRRSLMAESSQRNLSIALPELDKICSVLNVPFGIEEESARLYRIAVGKGLVRGRSIESVMGGIVYLVCRRRGIPKTLDELADTTGIKKKDIGKSYRNFCRRMNIKMPVATPTDFIPRFSSALDLSGETEAKATEIAKKAEKHGVSCGRQPTGIAAAAIYIAGKLTGDRRTQGEMARKLTGVTEVTIRDRAEELIIGLGIEFPERS